jgi:hypothetical protein
MAIPYIGKLFESSSTADPREHTVGIDCKAGSLVCIALGGKRSGTALDLAANPTDSKGNEWHRVTAPSATQFAGVAYSRLTNPLQTGDTITLDWNGTPSKMWASAHNFEGAADTPTDYGYSAGSSDTWGVTLDVAGSDWLTFGALILPNEYAVVDTPINSSIERDDNAAASVAPWCACFSRNGTTGSTHTIGSSGADVPYKIVGVSFPFLALPTAPARAVPGLLGV